MQNSTFQQESLSKQHIRDISFSSTSTSSDGPIIPPPATVSNRTLVLCFDGTGDQFDADNSNVVQFFSMLVKHNPSQLVYYQAGIGTYTIPDIATPLMAKISKTVDMMFGKHLDAHVMGGYEFLMQNYQDGDKICIFGFSRGAYTARALAGMVDKVGLIPTCNHQQVPFAYHMYSRNDRQGWENSKAFKQAFSINVNIEFVGVWDTVSSVGLFPRGLPFARASNCIKYFRHALALDERRVRFKPSTWQRLNEEDIKNCRHRHEHEQSLLENQHENSGFETDIQEVWFAGVHCDVGGGSVANGARNSLARIPLRWMIRECFKAKVGILFHRDMFKDIGMDHTKLYPEVHSRPDMIYHSPSTSTQSSSDLSTKKPAGMLTDFVSEEHEDMVDAMSDTHDQLKKAWWWWILELTPQLVFYQDDDDAHDVVVRKINMGHGRYVSRKHGIKVHRSVKIRMQNKNYVPKAKVDLREVHEWAD